MIWFRGLFKLSQHFYAAAVSDSCRYDSKNYMTLNKGVATHIKFYKTLAKNEIHVSTMRSAHIARFGTFGTSRLVAADSILIK